MVNVASGQHGNRWRSADRRSIVNTLSRLCFSSFRGRLVFIVATYYGGTMVAEGGSTRVHGYVSRIPHPSTARSRAQEAEEGRSCTTSLLHCISPDNFGILSSPFPVNILSSGSHSYHGHFTTSCSPPDCHSVHSALNRQAQRPRLDRTGQDWPAQSHCRHTNQPSPQWAWSSVGGYFSRWLL